MNFFLVNIDRKTEKVITSSINDIIYCNANYSDGNFNCQMYMFKINKVIQI